MARHVHADLIHAWAEGAEIEYFYNDTWWLTTTPQWHSDVKHRIKPWQYEGWMYRTLRDYFAAAALTGMYAGYQGNAPEPEQVASDAYFIADEMLKEREK